MPVLRSRRPLPRRVCSLHQAIADDELLSVAVLITEWIDRIAARDRDAGETSDAALRDDYLRWVDGDR